MLTTIPNKEAIRRISVLNHASYCYLLVISTDPLIHVFSDVDDTTLKNYQDELENWCEMKFMAHNESEKSAIINRIKKEGEKILPIVVQK